MDTHQSIPLTPGPREELSTSLELRVSWPGKPIMDVLPAKSVLVPRNVKDMQGSNLSDLKRKAQVSYGRLVISAEVFCL